MKTEISFEYIFIFETNLSKKMKRCLSTLKLPTQHNPNPYINLKRRSKMSFALHSSKQPRP